MLSQAFLLSLPDGIEFLDGVGGDAPRLQDLPLLKVDKYGCFDITVLESGARDADVDPTTVDRDEGDLEFDVGAGVGGLARRSLGGAAVLVWAQKPSRMALPCDEGSRPGLILPLCYKGCD